jgi:signal transduction histidine kinase/CheY-like chemotaxis protein
MALSASREKQIHLQSVVNHAAVNLWAVDREGIITVAEGPGVRELNLAVEKADVNSNGTKTGNENVIGHSIYNIWDVTNIQDSVYRALQGQTVVEVMEVKQKWLRNSYTPLRAHEKEIFPLYGISNDVNEQDDESKGSMVGVVVASMDITDRKEAQRKMEESLIEKARALTAEESAREASRLKSEFLANMSHEIRTPIAGIIGLTELLLDEEGLAASQKDYAETIQRSAEGLLAVINDILDFSKVEVGKLEVEQVPFNLVVLLRDLKRMMTFATQKKNLELRDVLNITYTDDLLGDLGRTRQVVMNLLTNAIKFTSHGYITLEASEVSSDEDNAVIRFDIRDTGCGICPEALNRLFQPFSQADASTARRFGGTGLGLSISKNLVELMNGTIGLNSVEGQGSHAWFIIPFQKASSVQTKDKGSVLEVPGTNNLDTNAHTNGISLSVPTSLNRPRQDIWVLVAEDNAVNAQIAYKNVKKLGFSCTVAGDGNAAMQELGHRQYDLVLMDCQMPDCDGYEATRLIRSSANDDIRLLPVIALTASAIKGDRERALDAGMVDYLAKPVKRPALEVTICKWLFDHTARQTLSRFLTLQH